jgi:hypothetical protein
MSRMKKNITPAKLALKLETVKTLKVGQLVDVVGGAAAHARPTTTVIRTFDC